MSSTYEYTIRSLNNCHQSLAQQRLDSNNTESSLPKLHTCTYNEQALGLENKTKKLEAITS